MFLLGLGKNGWGQTTTQPYNSSASFTVPSGVTQITIKAWGGGGAGGAGSKAGNSSNISSGGGGGGGGFSNYSSIAVIPGETYTITIGAGGNTSAQSGGNTTVTNSVSGNIIATANGGTGGTNASGNTDGIGGASGTGITASGSTGGNGTPTKGGNGGAGGSSGGDIGGSGGIGSSGAPGDGGNGFSPGGGGGGGRSVGGVGGIAGNGLVIISYCTPASITQQPVNTTVTYGENASFIVAASAGSYQWQVNSGSGWINISGATNASLSLTLPTFSMNGNQYRCIVTVNCGSAITSNAATLSVNKKSLTVTAGNQTVVYGTTSTFVTQNGTYTINGFVNSENTSVINGLSTISYNTTFTRTTPVGSTLNITPDVTGLSAGNYNFSAVPGTVAISKASQYIVFDPLSSNLPLKDFTSVPLTATASSGLPVTITLKSGSPATLNGNSTSGYYLTDIGTTGTITMYADQDGNSNYLAAARVTQAIDVTKSNQTISFPAINDVTYFNGLTVNLEATASSGLVVYNVVSGPASVTGSILNVNGTGEIWVTATQPGNESFNAAQNVTQSFLVAKGKQSITLDVEAGTLTSSSKITPSSTSGLPVTLNLGPGSAATGLVNNGSYYTLTGIGSSGFIYLIGNEVGNVNFLPADEIVQTIDLSKQNQTITFPVIPDPTYLPTLTVSLSATASSGLTVVYQLISGPATLSGNTITVTGAGIIIVKATQSGNSSYNTAPPVTQDFTVLKAMPQITQTDITKTYGDIPFTITPTSNSTGNLSLSGSNVSVFTLSGNAPGSTATITGAGTANLIILQEPSANYYGDTKTILVTVNKANSSFSFNGNSFTYNGNPQSPTVTVTGSIGSVTYTYSGTTNSGTTYGPTSSAPFAAGSYTIVATVAENANFLEVTSASYSFTIGRANATINVTGYTVTYNGNEHQAMGTASGFGINLNSYLNLNSTKHTNTGNYTDTWNFNDGTGNFNNASGNVINVIQPKSLTITANNQVKCAGNAFTFSGTEFISSGLVAGEIITAVTLSSTGADISALAGDYSIIPSNATGGTFIAGNYNITYQNGTMTVKPLPTLTGASQDATVCEGSFANINLMGLIPNKVFSLDYSINGVAQTQKTGLLSDGAGTSYFTTPTLTVSNNGQILRITGITFAAETPSCSKSFTQDVTLMVNPLPTLTGATQAAEACSGNAATISLTGLIPGTVSKVYYTINASAQNPATNIVADGSGNASFTTSTLTTANNGQTLQIYGIEITGITPTCFKGFTHNFTLTVNSLPTAIIDTNNSPVCSGSDATFTLTGNSGATVNYYINSGSNTTVTLTGGTATVTVTAATVNQTLTLISVANTNCSQSLSGSSTITVTPIPIIGSFN